MMALPGTAAPKQLLLLRSSVNIMSEDSIFPTFEFCEVTSATCICLHMFACCSASCSWITFVSNYFERNPPLRYKRKRQMSEVLNLKVVTLDSGMQQ